MFIPMPKINFIIHFFLEILHFKNPALWLAESILAQLETRILPDMALVVKYQKQYQFSFSIISRKNLWQFFFKKSKKPYSILDSFCPNFWQIMNFPGRKGAQIVFKYSNYLPSWKKSEKTNGPFLRKMLN